MNDPRPELLMNDDQVAWVPAESIRYDSETGEFLPGMLTRGQAKNSIMSEISSWGRWNTLRATKVWMVWDSGGQDPELDEPGGWVQVRRGTPGAHPYWRVEEMHKI